MQLMYFRSEQQLLSNLCPALNAGVAEGRLAHEDCALFLSIATRKPPLSVPRFAALVNDFASIARNENTADVLLAYEM
jgi:hypothetical protein